MKAKHGTKSKEFHQPHALATEAHYEERLADSSHPDDGGDTFLRNVAS
jgi:hypothetical protein